MTGPTITADSCISRRLWLDQDGVPAGLYLPLFRFCRDMRFAMVGLNVSRELVRGVRQSGWNGVATDLKEDLTRSLPSSASYRHFLFDLTGGAGPGRGAITR
ncbi:ChaN family lipoprotein [Paracoccus seriniphilus]|uniref:Haem-binding uptake, Tiki superfamily, ChaN n=1 Tax=Paracoccus seriniphilus TaxID=184748 RepID=A0A239Q016_9RHOB|nr:ChaN family lipoprotein [Paracoccus seriniphilus]WCR15716.1 ChaN family lipoprotein [Paracoccus seriniphilus]SNT75603.1 Haem-binding uptake, Tiki superfamily, ChaN [Paracoccus seriniphilus]